MRRGTRVNVIAEDSTCRDFYLRRGHKVEYRTITAGYGERRGNPSNWKPEQALPQYQIFHEDIPYEVYLKLPDSEVYKKIEPKTSTSHNPTDPLPDNYSGCLDGYSDPTGTSDLQGDLWGR